MNMNMNCIQTAKKGIIWRRSVIKLLKINFFVGKKTEYEIETMEIFCSR